MSPTQEPPGSPLACPDLQPSSSPPIEMRVSLSLAVPEKDTKPRPLLFLTQSIAGSFALQGKP